MSFLRADKKTYLDLSIDLREQFSWSPGILKALECALNVSSLAVDPVLGILAFGTSNGSIHIYGRPGVEVQLKLPEAGSVKFLQVSAISNKLLCMDDYNQLHLWDLSNFGRPRYICSTTYGPTNAITLSPSHNHAFIALLSGEVRTYDVECLRRSAYSIPNMWKLYERKMAASGMSGLLPPDPGMLLDTVIHPRDLNQLFCVYTGAIVLSDLTQRNTLRVYELILPPGAPGGGKLNSSEILSHRRPEVTSMATHPSGHFFVVGYADGSFAFWATEDEDQPVLVQTLDDIDVNAVNASKLQDHIDAGQHPLDSDSIREPIFKLSWSGFPNSDDARGGRTALTILGGLGSSDSPGASVYWLPAFNPPEAVGGVPTELHPHYRTAMRDSLVPLKTYFYFTSGTVQDFLLVPRSNPHFSNTFDPISILFTVDNAKGIRTVQALQFPPPSFVDVLPATDAPDDETPHSGDDMLSDLQSTLQEMQINDEPKPVCLPFPLQTGNTGLLHGRLIKIERDPYALLAEGHQSDNRLPLSGGFGWTDEGKATELKKLKHQPHRIVITVNKSGTLQFYDFSSQLLLASRPTPLQYDFPNPLTPLTIDINLILFDTGVSKRVSKQLVGRPVIETFDFSPETLECAVVLATGEIIIFHLRDGKPKYYESSDPEIMVLDHISPSYGAAYAPFFMLAPAHGSVVNCAISDIGFLAASYSDGSLLVIDMRGPSVILRDYIIARSRHSIGVHLNIGGGSKDIVSGLNWVVSALDTDSTFGLRLVTTRDSGLVQVYTFTKHSDSWTASEPVKTEIYVGSLLINGGSTIILNAKNGSHCNANRLGLSMLGQPAPDVFFIVAGSRGVRCHANITGDRLGKADWSSSSGKVQAIQVVERLGSAALVAVTDRSILLAYSLPTLELMCKSEIPLRASLPLSIDDSGDFIAWIQESASDLIQQVLYGTLFDIKRAWVIPDIDIIAGKGTIPPQPQPISIGPASILQTWLPFNLSGALTGPKADILFGGTERPIPEPKVEPSQAATGSKSAAALVASAGAAQSNLYSRLQSALSERGEILGDLENQFNNLEAGSRNMVSQAQRLAAEQTTKGWFGF